MSDNHDNRLSVALLYGENDTTSTLRQALEEVGAELVLDRDVAGFSTDQMVASGARVLLINLDDVVDAQLDELYVTLDESRYRVLFDDPETTNALEGWELARWQRHLGAKLRDLSDWDPPRPEPLEADSVPSASLPAAAQPNAPAAPRDAPSDDSQADAVHAAMPDSGADAVLAEAPPQVAADALPAESQEDEHSLEAVENDVADLSLADNVVAADGEAPPLDFAAELTAQDETQATMDDPDDDLAVAETESFGPDGSDFADLGFADADVATEAPPESPTELQDELATLADGLSLADDAPSSTSMDAGSEGPVEPDAASEVADSPPAHADAAEPAMTTSEAAVDDEQSRLEAELDALADADDPLAMLSSLPDLLAGDEPPFPSTPEGADDVPDATAARAQDVDERVAGDDEAGDDAGTADEPPYLQATDSTAAGADSDWMALDADFESAFEDTADAVSVSQAGADDAEHDLASVPSDETPAAEVPFADHADALLQGSDDLVGADEDALQEAMPDETPADDLEAELNAAFDGDTLSAIDAAMQAEVDAGEVAEVLGWEQTNELEEDTLDVPVADPPTHEQAAVPAADGGDEAKSDAGAGEASTWALLDDDELTASMTAGSANEAEDGGPDAGSSPDDDAVETTSSGIKLALLDPEDYLEPEAPKDVSTELFKMPETLSMAEVIAPASGDDAQRQQDRAPAAVRQVVVVVAALGGPDAARSFISRLPQRLPATVVLVQHLGSEFLDLLVSQLGASADLPVRAPARGERAVAGEVLVIPTGTVVNLEADGHLLVRPNEADDEAPPINQTLSMVAERFAAGVTAVLLSGMGEDAVVGAQAVADAGGRVWVQDPASCAVSTMVDTVIDAGLAQATGTPQELADRLVAHLQE